MSFDFFQEDYKVPLVTADEVSRERLFGALFPDETNELCLLFLALFVEGTSNMFSS